MGFCPGDYHQDIMIYRVIFLLIDSVVILTIVPILYRFIKYTSRSNKTQKILYYVGLTFIVCGLLLLCVMYIVVMTPCELDTRMPALSRFTQISWIILYFLQGYFLSIILFMKLYFVFQNTALSLSKFSTRLFITIYISLPLAALIMVTFPNSTISQLLFSITGIMFTGIFVTTMILYIRKLATVKNAVKYSEIDNESLRQRIARLTVLTIISISTTFLVPIIISTMIFIKPPGITVVVTLSFGCLCDTYTNLWCIIMCYKSFKKYYLSFCACLINRYKIELKQVDKAIKNDKRCESRLSNKQKDAIANTTTTDVNGGISTSKEADTVTDITTQSHINPETTTKEMNGEETHSIERTTTSDLDRYDEINRNIIQRLREQVKVENEQQNQM